jgi:hypothetical protein
MDYRVGMSLDCNLSQFFKAKKKVKPEQLRQIWYPDPGAAKITDHCKKEAYKS